MCRYVAFAIAVLLTVAVGCRKKPAATEPDPGEQQPAPPPAQTSVSAPDALRAKGAVYRNHAWYPADFGPIIEMKGPKFTDADVATMGSMLSLKQIYLEGAKVTDPSMKVLAELRDLSVLSVSGTGVTDAGVAHLAPLRYLTELYFNGTAVTDACLPTLGQMRNLTYIEVRKTRITDAGAQKLRQEISGLVVVQDAKFFDFTDPAGRFEVSFPGSNPTAKAGTMNTAVGKVAITLYEAVSPPTGAVVSFADFDAATLASADLEKIVEADRDEIAKKFRCKVTSDTRPTLTAGSVRDVVYEFEHQGKRGPMYFRWVIHGRRVYTLTNNAIGHSVSIEEKDRFFNSFKIAK